MKKQGADMIVRSEEKTEITIEQKTEDRKSDPIERILRYTEEINELKD